MDRQDDDFEALFREVLADPIAGAAACENDFRRMLGEYFENARRAKGLSVRELAKQMGTSLSQVQRLVHAEQGGKSSITLRTIFRAAHVLELNVSAHIREKTCASVDNVISFGTRAWSTNSGQRRDNIARRAADERAKDQASPWHDLRPSTEPIAACGGI